MTAALTPDARLLADLRRLARDLTWELNTAGPRLATILDQHQEKEL